MRWWHVILGGLTLTACGSDYDGESFPRVAEQDDIEVVSTVPEGARIIGTVSDLDSAETDGGFTEYALWCNVEDRLIRQMKRTAAREGGEYLVNVVCETFEEEDTSPIYDDPDTRRIETWLYCETYCEADVARRWVHDR